LPTNVRIGWKSLAGTDILFNYKKIVNYGRKAFYNIAPAGISESEKVGGHEN
jgi:hypothetical protein